MIFYDNDRKRFEKYDYEESELDEETEINYSGTVENDHTDNDIYEFYFNILQNFLDVKNKKNVRMFRLYCKLFREASDKFGKLNKKSELRDSFFYLLYNLYRDGPIISSAIAHIFEQSADLDSNILNRLLDKSEINICSFGGFPADVVGIVHKLSYAAEKKGHILNLKVNIIDFDEKWRETCFGTLLHLKPLKDCIDKIDFLLYFENNMYIINVLENADIISMTMFFSNHKRKKCVNFMQEVCNYSKNGCMILVFDYPKEHIEEPCGGYSGKWLHKCCIPIYDDIFGLHTLKDSALKSHSHRFRDLCSVVLPNYHIKYFVRIWVKSHFMLPSLKELDFDDSGRDLEMWFEMNKFNPILKEFRFEIEDLKLGCENMKKTIQKSTERRDFLQLKYDLVQESLPERETELWLLWNAPFRRTKFWTQGKKMVVQQKGSVLHFLNYAKLINSVECVEREYQAAEQELNEQKTRQMVSQAHFNSAKEKAYKCAWNTFLKKKRALVNEKLQIYNLISGF